MTCLVSIGAEVALSTYEVCLSLWGPEYGGSTGEQKGKRATRPVIGRVKSAEFWVCAYASWIWKESMRFSPRRRRSSSFVHTASEAPADPPATSRVEDVVRECEAAQLTATMPEAMIVSRLALGPRGYSTLTTTAGVRAAII